MGFANWGCQRAIARVARVRTCADTGVSTPMLLLGASLGVRLKLIVKLNLRARARVRGRPKLMVMAKRRARQGPTPRPRAMPMPRSCRIPSSPR